MGVLVGIFVFGALVCSMVTIGLLFAASAFGADAGPVFEGRGLAQEPSRPAEESGLQADSHPLPPQRL